MSECDLVNVLRWKCAKLWSMSAVSIYENGWGGPTQQGLAKVVGPHQPYLPTNPFFSSNFGHFILKIQKKFEEIKNEISNLTAQNSMNIF